MSKNNPRVETGFSLLEMVVTIAIMMILIAFVSPKLMSHIYATRIRYSATNLSGILQEARIEAVRKNTFYSVQQTTLANNVLAVFVDVNKNGVLVPSDPQILMGGQATVSVGAGSTAPGASTFITGLSFVAAPAGTPASFNARGLPCVQVGSVCPQTPGQGFVYFVSGTSGSGGSTGWASVVVTPSGRAEVWTYDGSSWVQR